MAMTDFMRFAACGLMATTLIVAGTTFVRAADDDEDVAFDKKIQQNVMRAIGLGGGPNIDYKERSPLVLPPKIDLPPPQNNAAAAAPNWPVDADVKRRKEETTRRRDEVEESRPLRPNELNVGERTRSTTAGPTQDQADGRPSRPGELGSKKDARVEFKSEPARTSLIEPPTGYQTPSPNQPYQFKYEKWTPKIPSFFDFGTDTK
jgi:hypothetical protein